MLRLVDRAVTSKSLATRSVPAPSCHGFIEYIHWAGPRAIPTLVKLQSAPLPCTSLRRLQAAERGSTACLMRRSPKICSAGQERGSKVMFMKPESADHAASACSGQRVAGLLSIK